MTPRQIDAEEGVGEIGKNKGRAKKRERQHKEPQLVQFCGRWEPKNQTIVGVGRHSILLLGDRHGHVIKSFTPRKTDVGVRSVSQNPYPIYDQNLRYFFPDRFVT